MIAFAVGVALAIVFFGHSVVTDYSTLSRRHGETPRERAVRTLSRYAWLRVAVLVVAAGVAAHVVWHGLGDVLASVL